MMLFPQRLRHFDVTIRGPGEAVGAVARDVLDERGTVAGDHFELMLPASALRFGWVRASGRVVPSATGVRLVGRLALAPTTRLAHGVAVAICAGVVVQTSLESGHLWFVAVGLGFLGFLGAVYTATIVPEAHRQAEERLHHLARDAQSRVAILVDGA